MLYLSMLICLFVYIPMVAIPKHLDDWFPRCLIVVVASGLSTMLSMYCGGRFTHQSFITIPTWGDHPFDLIIASSALCRIGVLTLFWPKFPSGLKPPPGNDTVYHGPPKSTCLEVLMVNNLVFRWPKPAYGMYRHPTVHPSSCHRSSRWRRWMYSLRTEKPHTIWKVWSV